MMQAHAKVFKIAEDSRAPVKTTSEGSDIFAKEQSRLDALRGREARLLLLNRQGPLPPL